MPGEWKIACITLVCGPVNWPRANSLSSGRRMISRISRKRRSMASAIWFKSDARVRAIDQP